ncbi:unnamed protein product [Ambrosiozyma monospora]|uniref:Unnamed protein product n=1 Tax=Ambrosiozyma monospora TaxID=43982 RepID=A0ACB5T9W6_AMBMO|nr:unnamed protein product [Ambrosiozyma monospora]
MMTVELGITSLYLEMEFLESLLIRCDCIIINQVRFLEDEERLWLQPEKVIAIHDLKASAVEKLVDSIQSFPNLKTITVVKPTHHVIRELQQLTFVLDKSMLNFVIICPLSWIQ